MSLQHNLKRVEKGYVNDLDNILKDIALHYNIYTSDTKNKVDYTHLYNKYISPILSKNIVLQCSAISLNGNRCSYKSIKDTNYLYCKKHMFKQKPNLYSQPTIESLDISNDSNDTVYNDSDNDTDNDTDNDYENEFEHDKEYVNDSHKDNFTLDNKIQKIIDNKLYYIDNTFIYKNDYKTNKLIKCGYINNDQYMLTDDPFILENI
jgi:hypothetical protein